MNWFKLYAEFAFDCKVQSMSEIMQRRLVMIFCLHCNGDLEKLDDEELCLALRISQKELDKTRDLFRRKGFIAETWAPKNWRKRQSPSDPTAAERMRRMRAQQAEHARNNGRNVTRNVTEVLRVETERESEEERDSVFVSREREGDDLRDWEEALAELQGHEHSRMIAGMLKESADVPSIAMLKGWQLIHAAHIIQAPGKPKTWEYFQGVARKASRREFEAWHDAKPDEESGPVAIRAAPRRTYNDPTPEQIEEATRKLKERTAARANRLG